MRRCAAEALHVDIFPCRFDFLAFAQLAGDDEDDDSEGDEDEDDESEGEEDEDDDSEGEEDEEKELDVMNRVEEMVTNRNVTDSSNAQRHQSSCSFIHSIIVSAEQSTYIYTLLLV